MAAPTPPAVTNATHAKEPEPPRHWSQQYVGATLHIDRELKTIQVHFDDMPDAEFRIALRTGGFRWSPAIQRWQAPLDDERRRTAEAVLIEHANVMEARLARRGASARSRIASAPPQDTASVMSAEPSDDNDDAEGEDDSTSLDAGRRRRREDGEGQRNPYEEKRANHIARLCRSADNAQTGIRRGLQERERTRTASRSGNRFLWATTLRAATPASATRSTTASARRSSSRARPNTSASVVAQQNHARDVNKNAAAAFILRGASIASCFVPSDEAKKPEARELLAHGRKDVCAKMRSNDAAPANDDGSRTSNPPTSEPRAVDGKQQLKEAPALEELPAMREYKEPEEVRLRLAEMDLDVTLFHEAISLSQMGRASATPLDPSNAAGTLAHIFLVRGLRTVLLARGWTKSNHRNCSLTISPDRRMAIRVSTGDEATGSDGVPTTKYAKGPVMQDMVDANKCLLLFSPEVLGLPPTVESDVEEEPRETWLLLTYPHDQGVASELSLPIAMTGSRPTGWAERIRLPVVPVGPDDGGGVTQQASQGLTGPDGAMVDIDVPVVRKTG